MDDSQQDVIATNDDEQQGTENDVQDSTSNDAQNDYTEMSNRLTRMEDAINRMSGVVSAMQKAQKSLVDMGAVIRENPADEATPEDDSFVPLDKLDFTM